MRLRVCADDLHSVSRPVLSGPFSTSRLYFVFVRKTQFNGSVVVYRCSGGVGGRRFEHHTVGVFFSFSCQSRAALWAQTSLESQEMHNQADASVEQQCWAEGHFWTAQSSLKRTAYNTALENKAKSSVIPGGGKARCRFALVGVQTCAVFLGFPHCTCSQLRWRPAEHRSVSIWPSDGF